VDALFEQIGEERLRALVDRFVDRVFDDLMIGFHFRDANRARVKAKEYELAAQHLGADVEYTGQPIRVAHAKHPIMGGQFERRLKILEEVFAELNIPGVIREHWLTHDESLRSQILRPGAGPCNAGGGLTLPTAET
jgi:truncated hemoglobin YjbI